jgi:hypothetical protein
MTQSGGERGADPKVPEVSMPFCVGKGQQQFRDLAFKITIDTTVICMVLCFAA